MFEKRKAARTKARSENGLLGRAQDPPPAESPASAQTAQARDSLALSALCSCGHARRDHRGLRIEVAGPCLVCACEQFRQAHEAEPAHDQTIQRIRAGIDRIEHLQEKVAALSGAVSEETLDREGWRALQREFCGATAVSVERVGLYVGAHEAVLVVALGDCPSDRWQVLWRGKLNGARP